MKKIKLLLATAALTLGGTLWAQTDVTDTYLTNADFSQGPAMTVNIHTYNKDKTGSNVAQMQAVDGWTIVKNGDARASGVFTYGDGLFVGGSGYTTPSTDPNGNTSGNALGMVAVWQADLQYTQNVSTSLPVGHYTLTFSVYNSVGGTSAINANYFGFIEDNGTTHYASEKTFTVNAWTTMTVSFDLSEATSGKISVGYKSTNSGSSAMPHLFLDKVTIMYTDPLAAAKDALQTEINNATASAYATELAAAIATAQDVLNNATTEAELNNAVVTLHDEILRYENGLAGATYAAPVVTGFVVNGTFDNSDISMWSCNTSFQNRGRKTGNDGNAGNMNNNKPWWENWNGTALVNKMYQTIENIPNGTYRLDITAFVNNFNAESQYVFANNDQTALTEDAKSGANYEVYTVVTNNTIEVGLEQTTATANWMGIDNVSLRYYGAGNVINDAQNASHKLAWEEAKAAAEAAIADVNYIFVAGSEKATLQAEIAKDEPTTAEGYDAAAEALNAATAAFIAAKPSYDALVAINANIETVGTLAYADPDKKPSANVNATSASDADEKTASQTTALRAYYESNALAEGWAGTVDMTSAIANPDAMDHNNGWTLKGSMNNPANSEPWTDASGNAEHWYFDGGKWGDSSWETTMKQDISIPAGRYLLTAKARAAENVTFTMDAGGSENVELPHVGNTGNVFNRGWGDASLEFETDGRGATIQVFASSQTIHEWFSIADFRLVRLSLNTDVYAGSKEYAALNNAISAAEAHTLGFDAGQYAPYYNVYALKALAAAKAIDQTAELTNLKDDVVAATEALNDASWSANLDDMDAIYNGLFATVAEGQNYPEGWTRTNGWGQMQSGIEGTYATAYYNQPGSLQYGNQGVYTMPLAANQVYKLSFAYRSHEDNSNNGVTASVLNGSDDGLDATTFPGNPSKTDWVSVEKTFVTGAAGNYVLTLANNGNTWLTDVKLRKSTQALVFSEEENYKPVTTNTTVDVIMTRTIKVGYNTLVLPFDLTSQQVQDAFGIGTEVYEFSENSSDPDAVTINFWKGDGSITANVPVLLYANNADNSWIFNNVQLVAPTDEVQVAGTNVAFKGVYAPTTVAEGDYFIGNGAVYKSTGETNIKAFRAYIDATDEVEVKMFIDGEEISTGIVSPLGETEEGASIIYNVAGQRISKMQKGINIVNGKKIAVK